MNDNVAKSDRSAKRFLWIPFGFTLATLGTILGISLYAAYSMTKVTRKPFEQKPDNFGLKYEDVSFLSRDGCVFVDDFCEHTTQGFNTKREWRNVE